MKLNLARIKHRPISPLLLKPCLSTKYSNKTTRESHSPKLDIKTLDKERAKMKTDRSCSPEVSTWKKLQSVETEWQRYKSVGRLLNRKDQMIFSNHHRPVSTERKNNEKDIIEIAKNTRSLLDPSPNKSSLETVKEVVKKHQKDLKFKSPKIKVTRRPKSPYFRKSEPAERPTSPRFRGRTNTVK